MRVNLHPSLQPIPKPRGAMLLRSSVPLDGYRATGTEKSRWDRLLTPDAATAFLAALGGATVAGNVVTFADPQAVAQAVAAGFVTLDIAGGAGPGKPPASAPSLGSIIATVATDEAAPAPKRTRAAKSA